MLNHYFYDVGADHLRGYGEPFEHTDAGGINRYY